MHESLLFCMGSVVRNVDETWLQHFAGLMLAEHRFLESIAASTSVSLQTNRGPNKCVGVTTQGR